MNAPHEPSAPAPAARAPGDPPRRRRRRRSRAERLLSGGGPFLLLLALALLSMGTIKIVEVAVPTENAQAPAHLDSLLRPPPPDEVRALAASLERGFVPQLDEAEDDPFADVLGGEPDPSRPLEAAAFALPRSAAAAPPELDLSK